MPRGFCRHGCGTAGSDGLQEYRGAADCSGPARNSEKMNGEEKTPDLRARDAEVEFCMAQPCFSGAGAAFRHGSFGRRWDGGSFLASGPEKSDAKHGERRRLSVCFSVKTDGAGGIV